MTKGQRGEALLIFVTAITLSALVAQFIYRADPFLRHDLQSLWQLLGGA